MRHLDPTVCHLPTQRGTLAALRRLRFVRAVDDVALGGPGSVEVRVRLHWWTWLTLGVIHSLVEARAQQIVDRCAPLATVITVRVR